MGSGFSDPEHPFGSLERLCAIALHDERGEAGCVHPQSGDVPQCVLDARVVLSVLARHGWWNQGTDVWTMTVVVGKGVLGP